MSIQNRYQYEQDPFYEAQKWPRFYRVLRGLVNIRQQGIIFGIWCDAWEIRISYFLGDIPVRISWDSAEALIDSYSRKPMNEEITIHEQENIA